MSNTPAKICGGVCVYACGCVSAKGKCETFACSAFSRSARKLSAAHSFPFCDVGGSRRLFRARHHEQHPRKDLRGCLRLCPTENTFGGAPVCACGCVNASQKCGRSPHFAFLRVTPKLSRCSLIFAPRNQRVFLYAVGGFLPDADAIDALRSNRYTFGAARRDWRVAQQSLDLRFGHFYPLLSAFIHAE